MSATYSILLLLVLLGLGVPVAWSFAGMLGFLVYIYDVNLNTLMLQGFRSLNSVILLALPLFIMAGYLMQAGGVAHRLINVIERIIQGRRGGIGATMILSCGVFGAIAGTATAAVASVGSIMVDPMKNHGYPKPYIAALLGISSLLGILIPPSVTMILFAVVTQQSVAATFAASIGPGMLLIIGLIIYNFVVSGKYTAIENTETQKTKHKSFFKMFVLAIPAMTMPVVILGGIYGGVFTPTEAAAVTVLLAVLIGMFIYKDLTSKKLLKSMISTAETTGIIVLILLFSFLIGRILVSEGVPQDLAVSVTSLVQNPIAILLTVNIFLVLAGMIIDDVSLTVVIAPLLLPLVATIGIDPIHFAAIVACSVVAGANSPPMAPVLYMSCKISNVTVHHSFSHATKLILFVAIPVQIITAFVPQVSLFLPKAFGLM